jgi:hypothetical protein
MEEAKPNLGLATTRELLLELEARGRVASTIHLGNDKEDLGADGAALYSVASAMLRTSGEKTLDYRTVDSE